ncbi:MAG: hypothetical protein LBT13_07265 [Treponema sp.]|jgi:hypothetical protein|nr:hypothetical protein [Treponema sp.]
MFKSLAGLFSSLVTLIRDSLLAKIILVIVLLILVLLIVVPLIRKMRRKRIKEKETQDIMQDLKVWRHLSQLVKGGDEHTKAKQILSDSIARINELLKRGFTLAVEHAQGLYRVPWYILLGEPRSGKSSLLRDSELELIPSTEEKAIASDNEGKSSLPVRMWLGTKAVIYDVSGRVFFDRWLDGSSAEWSYIVREICHKRRRKPLNGIILTIPADALLADSDSLSHKKAVLMANELGYLLHASGMSLPCYVIVTKLDMVNGFREYTGGIRGELRHQILGFENGSSLYEEEPFKVFWEGLLERLRLGAKQILSLANPGSTNRMDVTGKVYVFPENFAALYANLDIYLSVLFSADNFHGTRNTVFEGISFTAATDIGLSFSPGLAALGGQKTEDLVIPGTAPSHTQGYFIRDMLHRWVFNPSPHAVFTGKELIRRHIPGYILCGFLVLTGAGWVVAAHVNPNKLGAALSQVIAYYDSLNVLLKKGTPFESALLKRDRDNNYMLNEDPIAGELMSSRVQFYFNAVSYRDMPLKPPFGFWLSDVLVFGFGPNMGYKDRVYITNQLYGTMIRTPVIKSMGTRLIEQEYEPVVLDRKLRSAIHSFTLLNELKKADLQQVFTSNRFNLDPMIRYLMPELSGNALDLLNSYIPKYDRKYSFTMDTNYIYSDDFVKADQGAINIILSAWQRSAVYPDSLYGKIKRLIIISEEIVANYAEMSDMLIRINNVVLFNDVQVAVYDWKNLIARQESLVNLGRTLFDEIRTVLVLVNIPVGFTKQEGSADPFGDNLITNYLFNDIVINYAVKEYTALFNEDMDFVTEKLNNREGAGQGTGEPGAVMALRNEFSRNLRGELEHLQLIARTLRDNEFLSKKMEDGKDSESLFLVVEKLVHLASAIEIPTPDSIRQADFETNWQKGQYNIDTALDAYNTYTKAYKENEKVAIMIANARNMLLAQAYINRYLVFDTALSFLRTSEVNIATVVETRSPDNNLFSFSGNTIQSSIGGLRYNKSYDPRVVKRIIDDIVTFANLFTQEADQNELPKFLRNKDRSLYDTQGFRNYLGKYISYWGMYPDTAYIPVSRWSEFKDRTAQYKPYQINTVLQDLYVKSVEFLTNINDITLSANLMSSKNSAIAFLNDRISLLSEFMSTDADRMLSAWDLLLSDPEGAFKILRQVSNQEVKESYMTVYSGKKEVRIGWWDDFIMNGINILSNNFIQLRLQEFAGKADQLRAFPLCADAPVQTALSLADMEDIAALFGDMGAAQTQEEQADTTVVQETIHPNLFKGAMVQQWAQTLYRFAATVTNQQKPLVWTLAQPPVAVQSTLAGRERLLAVNRFRYVEVATLEKQPKRFSTYMNQSFTLTQGSPVDSGITLKFYKTSGDKEPAIQLAYENPWSIFTLYLHQDAITDEEGHTYIPILFEDRQGKYVYYVEVRFSQELPKPDAWYTQRTWPAVKVVNGGVTGSR